MGSVLSARPTVSDPGTTILRRGVLARVRTIRIYEVIAWVGGVAAVVAVATGITTAYFWWAAAGLACAAIRLAIATEYVHCDELGLEWRTVFSRRRVPWTDIVLVEVAARSMSSRVVGGGIRVVTPCLSVVLRRAAKPVWVTPSVWTPLLRQGEFVAAARLRSPVAWSDPDQPQSRSAKTTRRSSRSARRTRAARRPTARTQREQTLSLIIWVALIGAAVLLLAALAAGVEVRPRGTR